MLRRVVLWLNNKTGFFMYIQYRKCQGEYSSWFEFVVKSSFAQTHISYLFKNRKRGNIIKWKQLLYRQSHEGSAGATKPHDLSSTLYVYHPTCLKRFTCSELKTYPKLMCAQFNILDAVMERLMDHRSMSSLSLLFSLHCFQYREDKSSAKSPLMWGEMDGPFVDKTYFFPSSR